MTLGIVLGTRPEIIKLAPVIRECQKRQMPFFIIHTNQHYSQEMDAVFFDELSLPAPRYNLGIGSGTHGEQTGAALCRIEKVLIRERPDVVLVQGDTNTALAGALAAAKLHIPVGHVEAGLRSYDRNMPEEINRVLIDHSADFLFAPTARDADILAGEGILKEKVVITGNTIVDALRIYRPVAEGRSQILSELGISSREYILVTAHRQENVDDEARLKGIIAGLALVQKETDLPLIYPIHPRTKKRLVEEGIDLPSSIRALPPAGFFDFLTLEANARLCITDSGGVQEETCILSVPCVTVRDTTERPHTVEIGANMLASCDPQTILSASRAMLLKKSDWQNPFGDGTSSVQILAMLTK